MIQTVFHTKGARRVSPAHLLPRAFLLLLLMGVMGWMGGMGCATRAVHEIPNVQLVDPANNVHCGGAPTVAGWKWLREQGVTTSVNLDTLPDPEVPGITSRWFPITDLQQVFGPVEPQLAAALLAIGPDTFVHCKHGMNRSRTLIILYRLWVSDWSKTRAIEEADKFGWDTSLPALKEFVERQPEMLR